MGPHNLMSNLFTTVFGWLLQLTRPPTHGFHVSKIPYLSPPYLNLLSLLFFFFHSVFFPMLEKASPTFTPTTLDVIGQPTDSYQLLIAVVGSVTVTCVTILLALLALFFIRKTLLNRRRTFTYQSGSVSIHSIPVDFAVAERNYFADYTLFISPGGGNYSAV